MTKQEETLYTFHLTALEIGFLIGYISKEGFKIRKKLWKEIDEQIYSEKETKK